MKKHVPTVLAAVVLAAGCGNSDGDFRERAQAVCSNYAKQIEAIEDPRNLDELADSSGRIADLISKQVGEMRSLEAPGDQKADFEQWLKRTDEAVANAKAIQASAEKQDQPRINELAGDAARITLSADRLARDLKIPACMVEGSDGD